MHIGNQCTTSQSHNNTTISSHALHVSLFAVTPPYFCWRLSLAPLKPINVPTLFLFSFSWFHLSVSGSHFNKHYEIWLIFADSSHISLSFILFIFVYLCMCLRLPPSLFISQFSSKRLFLSVQWLLLAWMLMWDNAAKQDSHSSGHL